MTRSKNTSPQHHALLEHTLIESTITCQCRGQIQLSHTHFQIQRPGRPLPNRQSACSGCKVYIIKHNSGRYIDCKHRTVVCAGEFLLAGLSLMKCTLALLHFPGNYTSIKTYNIIVKGWMMFVKCCSFIGQSVDIVSQYQSLLGLHTEV